jgi:signal transduction histidine kinase
MVPFERVAKFIRQLTHDVRNGLSAVDLEAAFIAELVDDPEASVEVRKLRPMVANIARMLREISHNFQPVTVHRMPWRASTFFEELQTRLLKQFPEETAGDGLHMESRLADETIDIDLDQLAKAIAHIIGNAFQFRREGTPVSLTAFSEPAQVIFEVREPKEAFESQIAPQDWGLEPLLTTRSGGYGLGLFQTRQILSAHDAKLETEYRRGVLITRIVVPISTESGA